jgi:hypothetical protein
MKILSQRHFMKDMFLTNFSEMKFNDYFRDDKPVTIRSSSGTETPPYFNLDCLSMLNNLPWCELKEVPINKAILFDKYVYTFHICLDA